jgi:hypothetical protein
MASLALTATLFFAEERRRLSAAAALEELLESFSSRKELRFTLGYLEEKRTPKDAAECKAFLCLLSPTLYEAVGLCKQRPLTRAAYLWQEAKNGCQDWLAWRIARKADGIISYVEFEGAIDKIEAGDVTPNLRSKLLNSFRKSVVPVGQQLNLGSFASKRQVAAIRRGAPRPRRRSKAPSAGCGSYSAGALLGGFAHPSDPPAYCGFNSAGALLGGFAQPSDPPAYCGPYLAGALLGGFELWSVQVPRW